MNNHGFDCYGMEEEDGYAKYSYESDSEEEEGDYNCWDSQDSEIIRNR